MKVRKIFYRVLQIPLATWKIMLPVVNAKSWYPAERRKNWLQRFLDVFASFVFRRWNPFYNAYGLDLKGSSFGGGGGYVSEDVFWDKMITPYYCKKSAHSIVVNHAVVLRDKCLFGLVMKAYGIPTPKILAHAANGRFYVDFKEVSCKEYLAAMEGYPTPFFLKDDMNCCGSGVFKIFRKDGKLALPPQLDLSEAALRKADILIQECAENHPAIAAIYPHSVNTARMVTVWDDKAQEPVLFAQGLRIGANGNFVDNWAAGGLFCEITDEGELGEYGYFKSYKHAKGSSVRVASHPDTGVVFKGYKLPDYGKAKALVQKAHAALPHLKSIGWDIAFTPNGPMLIEGNEDWEISLMQIVSGGLAVKARQYFNI